MIYPPKVSPLSWKFHNIKGRQDDDDSSNIIDKWGRMNIDTDRLAKYDMWRQIHEVATHHRHEAISVAIQHTTI